MATSIKDAFAAIGIDTASSSIGDASEKLPECPELSPVPGTAQPIQARQITPGLVILDLDPTALLEDRRVTYTGRPAQRSGPFVCVSMTGDDETTWTGLTRKHRIERLPIEPSWRVGGSERWRTSRQFITDGANLWCGPPDAFAAAAWRETFTDPADLPRLTDAGLDAVRRKVDAASERRGPQIGGAVA